MRLLAALVTGGALLTLNLGPSPAPHRPRAGRADDGGRQLAALVSYDCGAALLTRAQRPGGVEADLLELAARQFRACLACASPGDAAALVGDAQRQLQRVESLLAQARCTASAAAATTAAAGTAPAPERLPAPRETPEPKMVSPDGVPYRRAVPVEDHQAVGKSLPVKQGDKRKRAPSPRPERQTDRSPPLPRVGPEETLPAPKPNDMRIAVPSPVAETPAPPAPQAEGKMVGPDGVVYKRDPAAAR